MNQKISEIGLDHGGWSFAFPPAFSAQVHPAIWLACDVPSVIVFQDTAENFDGASIHSMLRHFKLLQDRTTSKGRHLVLSDGKRHRRILVMHACCAGRGCLVAQDQWVRTRLRAIEAFDWSCRRRSFIRTAQKAGFALAEIAELLALDATNERERAWEVANNRI